MIQNVFDANSNYKNNKIKIIANLKNLFDASKFDGNTIEINGNVKDTLLIGASSFKNNVVTLNGNAPQYIIGLMSKNLNQDIEIENNKFIINDQDIWNPDSKYFIFLYDMYINNFNIHINNNIIEIPNQNNDQVLIQLHTIKDSTPQKIDISYNQYNNFKKIVLYNNQSTHKILINGKEITYSTTLE